MTGPLTIVSPNVDQAEGAAFFHVHATGCADLRKPRYRDAGAWATGDVAAEVRGRFSDVGYCEGYRVFPCVPDARAVRAEIELTEAALVEEVAS